jgi:hypothetical protein
METLNDLLVKALAMDLLDIKIEAEDNKLTVVQGHRVLGRLIKNNHRYYSDDNQLGYFTDLYFASTSFVGRSQVTHAFKQAQHQLQHHG